MRQFVGWAIKSTRSVHPESIRRTKESACYDFATNRTARFPHPVNSQDKWQYFYDYAKDNCVKVVVKEKEQS